MSWGSGAGSARQVLAGAAGVAVGIGAYLLVSDPYRILAAAVLGVAATLALWPLAAAAGERRPGRELRVFGRKRVRELEAEVTRLTAELERTRAEQGRFVGALRRLDEWAAANENGRRHAVTAGTRFDNAEGGQSWS